MPGQGICQKPSTANGSVAGHLCPSILKKGSLYYFVGVWLMLSIVKLLHTSLLRLCCRIEAAATSCWPAIRRYCCCHRFCCAVCSLPCTPSQTCSDSSRDTLHVRHGSVNSSISDLGQQQPVAVPVSVGHTCVLWRQGRT